MSGLVLKNINKTFPGDQQAIRDFNLEVKDREFLILVGPTACGKSTLLRMIGGLEEITSGSLLIDGIDMTDTDPKERNVAMLFKNSVLYPGMSVEENLMFSLRMAKMNPAEIERRVEETAKIFRLLSLSVCHCVLLIITIILMMYIRVFRRAVTRRLSRSFWRM